jgi:hypothetical protein
MTIAYVAAKGQSLQNFAAWECLPFDLRAMHNNFSSALTVD